MKLRDDAFDRFFLEHGIPPEKQQAIERAAWQFLPNNPRPSICEFVAAMGEVLKASGDGHDAS